ncbi:MAG: radical SAM protein, partial [Deltaproteobacteria bacterium]
MNKAALSLERVYFDPALEETPWGLRALEAFASFRPEPRERESLKEELLFGCQDPLAEGKKVLLLAPYPGQLVKRCPGTKGYTCCGYWVINALLNCPMDCSYCILQGYLQEPYIVLNLPLDKAFEEVRRLLDLRPRHILRLGTGEFSDSLALDLWIGFNQEAISFFSQLEGALLELKTKAQEVDHLLGLDHRSRTVISWSLNPQRIVEKEEIYTAPLQRRLEAARRCQEAGYLLGFHFDPIIEYPGWEDDYRGLIEELFRHVDPRGVIWISLGTLRYPPGLERVIRERFPAT